VAGENYIIKSFMIFTPPNIVRISNQKKDYTEGACITLARQEKSIQDFYRKN